MTDLAVPRTILDRIQALEYQVRTLGRSPSLTRSAVSGGGSVRFYNILDGLTMTIGELAAGGIGVEVYDDNGQLVARFGGLDGGADDGFELRAGGITVMRADSDGVKDPVAYIPAVQPLTSLSVAVPNTGASYTMTHFATVVRQQHKYLRLRVYVSTAASTTALIRLRTSSGQTSNTLSVGAGSGVTAALFLELTAALGTPDLSLWIEVRNPSGPGNVTMGTPEVALGDFSSLATTAGFWL